MDAISHDDSDAWMDMAVQGASDLPDTWPITRAVEVARNVLASAGVLDILVANQRLRDALSGAESRLANYGRHHAWCASQVREALCNCGFEEALLALADPDVARRKEEEVFPA